MVDQTNTHNPDVPDVPKVDTPSGDSTGYKRPPAKSRFRKGQSGNPFGRRKGQRNMPTILNEILLKLSWSNRATRRSG